ncbi:MAG: histidine phosphatase family protein [Bacteroidales bacterium]|nr:histidine phosphatase family protein [Bacteroidales bacterium]
MRTLVLIRHAKAESAEQGVNDFNRKLTDGGKSDAAKMASLLKKQNINPQLLICSSAKRAYQTCAIFAGQFSIESKEIVKKNRLYDEIDVPELKQLLTEEAQTRGTVFVVGHNPTLANLIGELTTDFDGHLPTSGVAVIKFNIDNWDELGVEKGEMKLFATP